MHSDIEKVIVGLRREESLHKRTKEIVKTHKLTLRQFFRSIIWLYDKKDEVIRKEIDEAAKELYKEKIGKRINKK